jgi:hypothetical protein
MLNEASPVYLWGSASEALDAFAPSNAAPPVLIEIAVARTEQLPTGWLDAFEGTLHAGKNGAVKLQTQEYGYDVADRYLVSGLSNCMLPSADLDGVRRAWAVYLNPYGLFSKQSDAVRYTTFCDRLVPEHAPFLAYRIARVVI